jgi:hypothetical protein
MFERGGSTMDQDPTRPLTESTHLSGEQRLRAALGRLGRRRPGSDRPRTDNPRPYDDDWGWWVEKRLERLDRRIQWLVTLAAGALAAEVIRITCNALGLLP